MRPDNSRHLRDAARRRAESTLARAHEALAQLSAQGVEVTVAEFVRAAGVSRSWLYTQPELLALLVRAAPTTTAPTGGDRVPPAQRASIASVRRRLELAHERIGRLNRENERLQAELERAYGQLRAARTIP